MKTALIVALGGAIGSVLRYFLYVLSAHFAPDWRFPIATFSVNILGCLLVGVLAGLVLKQHLLSLEVRLFLFTGIAGGFTTFSAFGLETFYLLRKDEVVIAASYVVSSIIVGIAFVWLGFMLTGTRS